MAEVWVATNLTDDGKRYGLVHADELRHFRLVGEPRPRLLVQVPGGEASDWVPLVDSPERQYARFSGVMDGSGPRPPLPDHFHLELARALDGARLRAREEGHSLVVRPVVEDGSWVWRAESYAEVLGDRPALTEVPAPRAAAS